MNYKKGEVSQILEEIITNAGVKIKYAEVHDDIVEGAIWARSDPDSNQILMPDDPEAFPDEDTACLILGHEMGHIITRNDSPYDPILRQRNESECNLIGVYLTHLAIMTWEERCRKLVQIIPEVDTAENEKQFIKVQVEEKEEPETRHITIPVNERSEPEIRTFTIERPEKEEPETRTFKVRIKTDD